MSVHRASGPGEFLALLPHLAGMPVGDSVVLVPFTGNRATGAMRFDRAGFLGDSARAAVTAVGLICNVDTADGLVLVLSTPNPTAEATGDLLARLAARERYHEYRYRQDMEGSECVPVLLRALGALTGTDTRLSGNAP